MGRERGQVIGVELKATGASERIISGYASRWDEVDAYGDRVMRGAFTKTLREKVPLMLWQHSALEPCGRWDVLREDSRGLYVEGRLADTSRGRDAYALFKLGAIRGLSIGFVAKDSKPNKTGGRDLFAVDLWEISPVSFAACPHAEVDSVKMQNRLEAAVDRLCKALGEVFVPAAPIEASAEPSRAWRMAMTEQQHQLQQPHGRW